MESILIDHKRPGKPNDDRHPRIRSQEADCGSSHCQSTCLGKSLATPH